ncbi:MAG: hypothetical protein F4X59_06800 [Holophagales bacterium]|nr:hypothetical protein [Holophagales bacterium]MYC09827.1 hypothetical protein [Holophagales bacterium]
MKRRLREAGFDDEQVQRVFDVTRADEQRRSHDDDGAELKQDVALLKQQMVSLDDGFVSFRDGIVARLEASEERVKSEIAGVRSEMALLRTDLHGEIADVRGEGATLRGEVAELRTELRVGLDGLKGEWNARFESLEKRMVLIVWLMGVGLTLYTGTTVSLMVLLFRNVAA